MLPLTRAVEKAVATCGSRPTGDASVATSRTWAVAASGATSAAARAARLTKRSIGLPPRRRDGASHTSRRAPSTREARLFLPTQLLLGRDRRFAHDRANPTGNEARMSGI